jgi:UPF0176 protein
MPIFSSPATIDKNQYLIAAFYLFIPVPSPERIRERFLDFCQNHGIFGTILLATEGINGTIAGEPNAVHALMAFIKNTPPFEALTAQFSMSLDAPFRRMKVKLKKEIVTLGVDVNPRTAVGEYIDPHQWNAFIEQPDVLLIDTRNDYEFQFGTFKNAINPKTDSFREFPAYVAQQFNPTVHKKIAMFCTGGIRCEKATSFMLQQGFEQVYHLKGGILSYLAEIPEQESLWQGACFVFDDRVSIEHGLVPSEGITPGVRPRDGENHNESGG